MGHIDELNPNWAGRIATDRQSLIRRETENFLRDVTEMTFGGRARRWRRDYSSIDRYLASVAPMRSAWSQCVGEFDLTAVADQAKLDDYFETDQFTARCLTLPVNINMADTGSAQQSPQLCARAVLALPKAATRPLPLVIAQHGIGSCPERVFGLADDGNVYHRYGRRLVEAGYAVLAPAHITEHAPRARYQRMCLMLGKTLWGLEIGKLKALIDYALTLPFVSPQAIGMWGISLGGAYTLFATALEPRITVAVCTAWFNDRLRKMIIDDPRYSCFLSTAEEHIFIPGWLRDFGDSDLVSLICPRPAQIQTGKGDSISWWPQVQAEYERALEHYTNFDMADRLDFYLHDGGHEIDVPAGLGFLQRWLPVV